MLLLLLLLLLLASRVATSSLGMGLVLALVLVSCRGLGPNHVQLGSRWYVTRPDGLPPESSPSRPVSAGVPETFIPLHWLSLSKLASQLEQL